MGKVPPLEPDGIGSQQAGILFGTVKHTLVHVESPHLAILERSPRVNRAWDRLVRKQGNLGETRVEKATQEDSSLLPRISRRRWDTGSSPFT